MCKNFNEIFIAEFDFESLVKSSGYFYENIITHSCRVVSCLSSCQRKESVSHCMHVTS